MFTDKNAFDIMINESNLLNPRTCENDFLQAGNSFSSIYSQSSLYSTLVNQSSSSADSTSPESHPDIFTQFPKVLPEQSNQITPEFSRKSYNYNNPFIIRKRAIVGRKILYSADHSMSLEATDEECDLSESIKWVDELLSSSPKKFEESNVTCDVVTTTNVNRTYALFPTENTYGLQVPIPPTVTSRSPIASNNSPTFSTCSGFTNLSSSTKLPTVTQKYTTPSQLTSYSPPNISHARSSKADVIVAPKMCSFCRKNGETPMVYMAHSLKQKVGSKVVVTCPILRSHVCPACNACGDNAHTITYCPVTCSNNNGKRLESTTISLKNTRVKSNGKRRF